MNMSDPASQSSLDVPMNPATHEQKEWVEFEGSDSQPAQISVVSENRSPSKQSADHGFEVPRIGKPVVQTRRARADQNDNVAKVARQRASSADDIAKIDISLDDVQTQATSLGKNTGTDLAHEESGLNDNNDQGYVANGNVRQSRIPNGKIITTIMPCNAHCAWFTPAYFDPYKMPKSLISDSLTMPVETYVECMEKLTNDFRFRLYTVAYRRVIVSWFLFCLLTLVIILLSGLGGLTLFGVVLVWLLWTSVGVLACLHLKRLINRHLHRCVASVNKGLMKYNLLLGIEDRGKMSCHKVALMFVYFDWKPCIPKIVQLIRALNTTLSTRASNAVPSVSVNVTTPGDPISYGQNFTDEQRAKFLIAKCSQSYVKALSRQTIRFPTRPSEGSVPFTPAHCSHSYCLCQYVQVHYFDRPPRTLLEKIFLTDGVEWTSSTYVDPGYHVGIMP